MVVSINVGFWDDKDGNWVDDSEFIKFDLEIDEIIVKENIIDMFENHWSHWSNDEVLSPQWEEDELYEETYLYSYDEENFLDVAHFLILAVQKPILYKFENVTDLAFSVFSCHFTYQSQKYEFALNDQYMHSWFYDYSPFKVTNVSDGYIEFIEEYTADDF